MANTNLVFLFVVILLITMNFYLVSKTSTQNQPLDRTIVSKSQEIDLVTDVNVIPKVNVVPPIDLVIKVDLVPQIDSSSANIRNIGSQTKNSNSNNGNKRSSLDAYRVSGQKVNFKTIPNEILVLRKIVEENDVSFFSWQGNQDKGEDNILKYLVDTSFETEVRQLFNKVLNEEEEGIVLDIGANSGYYGLLGAAYGHSVLAFEPQPHCRLWISASVQMNGFNDQYWLFPKMVSNEKFSTQIDPRTGCWGTWPLDKSAPILPHNLTAETVSTIGVDEVMDTYFAENPEKPIWMMKIDVEGAEQKVLASAHRLLATKLVKNLLIEINGVRWATMKVNHTGEIAEFDYLYDLGYVIRCTCFGSLWTQQPLTREGYKEWLTDYGYSADCWAHLEE